MSAAKPNWFAGRRALLVGSSPALDSLAKGLTGFGAATSVVAAETEVDAIAAVFDAAEQETGGTIDILVHTGANMAVLPAHLTSLEQWRAGFSADVDSRFFHAAEFARRNNAAAGHGAILFLMPSTAERPGRSAQASAHGALDNLVKSLGAEWGRDAIRINAIASGVVENFAAQSTEQQESLVNLSAYLLSGYGSYVTGMVMGIDELA